MSNLEHHKNSAQSNERTIHVIHQENDEWLIQQEERCMALLKQELSTVSGWYISIDIQSKQDTYIYLEKQKIGDCKIFEVQKT